jgi:hypothetical protein
LQQFVRTLKEKSTQLGIAIFGSFAQEDASTR